MKVLSLFDGMACGMLAFQSAGIEVESYDAYEIDKYAVKTATHNFPNIKEPGDVFTADFTQYRGIDFVVGGSPCTYWSIAQKNGRETEASGMGWDLFSQYLRAVNEAQPKYFIYENNKSMSKAIRASIDKAFGFEAVFINSALVSAQNRQRLYWVGKRNADGTYSKVDVKQPRDRGLTVRDILETCESLTSSEGAVNNTICLNSKSGRGGVEGLQPSLQDRIYSIEGKSPAVTTAFMPKVAVPIRVGTYPRSDGAMINCQQWRIYGVNGKSTNLNANGGGQEAKTGLYAIPSKEQGYEVKDGFISIKGKQYPIKLADGCYIIRKLTITECKRLQTVPEWYEFPVSTTQAYKMLGNGWTVEVIAHLIKSALSNQTKEEPRQMAFI